jgi:CSLREA domain-containing protein
MSVFRLSSVLVFIQFLAINCCLAAPLNDNWANREIVAVLPFTSTVAGVEGATIEASDPPVYCVYFGYLQQQPNSVWYEFSPGANDAYVNIRATGYDTLVAVYEGNPVDGFRMVTGGCNDDDVRAGVSYAAIKGLRLRAGGTYSILVTHFEAPLAGARTLNFTLSESPVRQVTKQTDTDDGICDSDCSLREAIGASVQGTPGAVLIPAGRYVITGGISLATDVNNKKGIALYGAGMNETILDANFSAQVLRNSEGGSSDAPTIILSGLSLVNGVSSASGGAMESEHGYLVLDHVGVRNNTAASDGGGISAYPAPGGSMSVFDSEFTGNRALHGVGGGLWVSNDRLEVVSSLFSGNEALDSPTQDGCGGALLRSFQASQATNSTFSGNDTNGRGGGLCLGMRSSSSSSGDLRNLTIANNRHNVGGANPGGGGLHLDQSSTTQARPITLINSVVSGNRDGSNPGILEDCLIVGLVNLTTGYDLAQAPGNCGFLATGDVIGSDPRLLPLSAINSPHPVHVPAIGSPLVDQGDPGTSCAPTDARGVARPQDGDGDLSVICDIGAVERQPADDFIFQDGFDLPPG